MVKFLLYLEDIIISIFRILLGTSLLIIGGHWFLRFLYPKKEDGEKSVTVNEDYFTM